jgi:heat shock protein HslJ
VKKSVAIGLVFLLLAGVGAMALSISKEGTEEPKGATVAARSTLTMKSWKWVSTTYSDGKKITAKTPKFVLTFAKDGTFSSSTDCNTVAGKYTDEDKRITLSAMVSTLMACENSQESEYTKALGQVSSYFFRTNGELVFDLKYDSGSSIFN